MADEICRSVLNTPNVKALTIVCTLTANEGRTRHHLSGVASVLLAQALTGGLLMAALQKGKQRVNLQLECDGPLHGLFVDASAEGTARGYVKNPNVRVLPGEEAAFRWRPALGNSGFLSVLRDVGTEYYRSSVELKEMALVPDLNFYFDTSEQVPTRIALEAMHHEDGEFGVVAGALVQALPDGDADFVTTLGTTLQAKVVEQMREHGVGLTALTLTRALFGADDLQVLETNPVSWKCTCSKERVLDTLASMGKAEVQDILLKDGQAAVTCQFCNTTHVATGVDLTNLIALFGAVPSA